MPHVLKNKNLEVHVDLPFENYDFSRFDWTGKITQVKFQDIELTGIERADSDNVNHLGKGLYNEFGIDQGLGFDDVNPGDWFHKIGIGALKKEGANYMFSDEYQIEPAEFETSLRPDSISIGCRSALLHGFAYFLKKEIHLSENGFSIHYHLKNTGQKSILTNEYVHNFMAIEKRPIGKSYILRFPFQIRPDSFEETVNPEQKATIGDREIQFNGTPQEQFFFSNLSGGEQVQAEWELINTESKIGIRETTDFRTDRVNLWGWKHVISPELFYKIDLNPGESVEWERKYSILRTK